MIARLLTSAALIIATPAFAQAGDPLAPLPQAPPETPPEAPTAELPDDTQPVAHTPAAPVAATVPAAQVPKSWREVFDAIDRQQWMIAQAGINFLPNDILKPLAKAELYTARNSPKVDGFALQSVVAQAPELPQAEQLARMAQGRGGANLLIIPRKPTVTLGYAPVRYRAKNVTGEPYADQLRTALQPLIDANDAATAEALLIQYGPQLSFEARAEMGQRVAWIYYILGLDLDARRVAEIWRQGSTGQWSSQAAWISALASWRMGDCNSASRAFQDTGRLAVQSELRAAGYYWAGRAEQACHRPRNVQTLLKTAATNPESFYGLIARETLGMPTRLPADPNRGRDPAIDQLPNVYRAQLLVQMGQPGRADELIRHQAKIGNPQEHHALIELSKRLNLPAAQLWLANHGQRGAQADPSDRYPNPSWTPLGGWRIDPALAFGHIIQESSFRQTIVSPAGAVGLMQVLPTTAAQMARRTNMNFTRSQLDNPVYNLEYGQRFIEAMRANSRTGGQLPKVIASYNAGPLPLERWAQINDKGDPLLWIESLSYWETRYYIPSVMRNMWVYQGLNNARHSDPEGHGRTSLARFSDRPDKLEPLAFVLLLFYDLGRCQSNRTRDAGRPAMQRPRAFA